MNFKEFESTDKLRGGYYTPDYLSDFILRWIKNINPKKILEPSCGDGIFLKSIENHIKGCDVTALELLKKEAAKARKLENITKSNKYNVMSADFLDWALPKIKKDESSFDAVVGNPPFIRYQYLPQEFQINSECIFKLKRCKFTKHTNSWVPFLISSISLLRAGGRLGMVIPSEIMHVMHARSLREYLEKECKRILIIDPEELWFEDTLQGAIIIFAEKKFNPLEPSTGLIVERVRDREFLKKDPERLFPKKSSKYRKDLDQKWMRALISKECDDLLIQLSNSKKIRKFVEIASVDVGIVTGANKFFLVNNEIVENNKLHEYAHPMFGRSDHCPGIIYNNLQHKKNEKSSKPTNFLFFKDSSVERKPNVKKYINKGVSENLHTRYKCRIREPWYTVPSVYKTKIGMLKRCHDAPRLILNEMGAYTTDTAYRIKSLKISSENLVYAFINPLTSLCAEIEGRHYGGGVLELVPSEIEEMLIPVLPENSISKYDLGRLNDLVQTQKMKKVLEEQSNKVLSKAGITKKEQLILLENWDSLRLRRQRVSA